jgi:hypothetical protein
MKNIFLCFTFFLLYKFQLPAATVFSQDGIKLNYQVSKTKTVFIPGLKKKVIIWKSEIELFNTNNRPVAVTAPCCLYYAYSYLFPAEIAAVQSYMPEMKISDLYKAYATTKPTMLNPKQKVSNQQYFATFENVNLNDATYNLEVKYSF